MLLLTACAPPAPGPPPSGTSAPAPTPIAGAPRAALRDSPAAVARPTSAAADVPGLDGLSPEQRSSFAAAQALVVEGDWLAAAERWSTLRHTNLPAATASEARFQSAYSLTRADRGADALQILDSSPSNADSRDAFIRGLALDAAGQHARGMQSLADYALANAGAAPAVWIEIAERELTARRPREAADAAAKVLDTAQARPLKRRALEVRGQALATLGESDAALDAHRQVLALATTTATLGEQLFHLAMVSRDLGKRDAAVQALHAALGRFPEATTTADALRLLDELQATAEVDPFVLGRARYATADYRNAVTAFEQYLTADPNGPDAPSARLYSALASLTPGNEPHALAKLDAIADDANQQSEIAAQALLEAGQALEGLSEPDQAEARYQKLLQKFPRLDAAASAAFRLGLVRYVRGADLEAIGAWDGLVARRDDLAADDVSRALYWRGKALARLARQLEARDSFALAAAVTPSSYYSLRAGLQIGQLSDAHALDPQSASLDEEQLTAWLAGHNQDMTAATATVANDPALLAARADAAVGLFREGNWQADELLQRYPDRADRLYVLARRFSDLGLAGGSTLLGEAAYRAASIQSPRDAPRALLQVAFPRPYADLTDAAAERYGVDPLLLESTFRDASQFDPWADDVATGARGLALTSPVHTEEVRSALKLQAGVDDGPRPIAAVQRQAWLMADRLRRFDGRAEVALSALDSADRVVDGWLVRPGAEDADAYVELIDFQGVRAAVHGVLATRLGYAIAYTSVASADPTAAAHVKPEPTSAWIKIARLAADVPSDAPVSPPGAVGTADEQAAFSRGATLQRDGDYAAAELVFRDLAASPLPSVSSAAQLRLAQALIGAGRSAEAIAALQIVQAAQPDNSPATFLLGRSLADSARCQDAIGYFERIATANPGPLAAQAQAAEANCLSDLGRSADAVGLFEHAVATSDVSRLQTLDFREKLALTRVRAGDLEAARTEYEALLSLARSDSYRAELTYYLGLLAPDASSAAAHFRSSVQVDQRGRGARAALDELAALHDPFALSFEAGETRFQQNRYRDALTAYSTFLEQNPTDPRVARAEYARGASLVRLGQERAGIGVLENIAARFPNTSEAADGLFRAGRIRETLADLDGAARAYQRVMAQSGPASRAADAQFRLAFVRFQQDNFGAAVDNWRDLASRTRVAEAQAQSFFWLGKALRATGDEIGARDAWTSARDADPTHFYGIRAADLLAGAADPLAQVDEAQWPVQTSAGDDPMRAMQAWVASRADASMAPQVVFGDAGLARADMLLSMGLRQAAIWELSAAESRVADNSVGAVGLLGAWEQQRGLYNTALLLGFDLARMASLSPASGPVVTRKLVYPLPNPAVLAQAAQQQRVDPLLFASLMLQESVMDQAAESNSQARGLSQMIASTGYAAARALGQYGFVSSDLFRPRTSINLGAFLLGQHLRRYDNRIFPALAAYNAAAITVDGWLLSAGSTDMDTFAEAIPFTETYAYVQRIYENYKHYLELYGNPSAP